MFQEFETKGPLVLHRLPVNMETKEKWLWKMTSTERFYEPFAICYQLTLVTRKPLLEEQVSRTLSHVYRKVPLLRTCFGERDGETWLREMPREIIDFEVLPEDKMDDDLHAQLQRYSFNKRTGPMWCVKLRPGPHFSPDGVFREEVQGFPHAYSLFFVINHAITDGTSNAYICGFLVQILEDVLAGKPINDTEQLGIFVSDERTKKVMQEQVAVMKGDPELQSNLVKDYQVLKGRYSLLKRVFKGVGEEKARSAILTRDLDAETTAAFIKRCRAEGVTVNSTFTAICNFALVDVLVYGGLEQDSYSIRSEHVLNARRYWKGDTSQYLGCHLTEPMHVIVEIPRDFNESFWDYARLTNEEFQTKLKSGAVLLKEAVKELVSESSDFDPSFELEFGITNMGDVTKKVTEGGDHVQVVHVIRTAAVHNVPFIWANFVHTFRGHLTNTLVYNTLFVTPKIAELFFERSFHYLQASLCQ
ncbi:uncharacterized protein LOC122251665 [Penaeus japonicus]|uniref:uncharacterized protein LOC122251665 n=1 Tax=Penaeus japonicus TaxID=27405 RepID=UPI001C7141B9|nr:uncharacterized protein LOC122251665 [Penaeus japonicus]